VANPPLILVVEDDMEMNELQRELLALHGMESLPAYTGSQALELAKERLPDAVLLDIMLPELDGFEVCRQLRMQTGQRHLPVIMLTALDTDDCRQKGFACGADAYFVKPFDPDDVVNTLQSFIRQG
jgi:two-component system alkaline phosphatase synthesis response regulator PhoP